MPRTKGKGEDGSDVDESTEDAVASDNNEAIAVAAPAKPSAKRKKRSNNKKSSNSASSSSTTSEAHQPDPRWANDLERLKQQLLEAQGAAR